MRAIPVAIAAIAVSTAALAQSKVECIGGTAGEAMRPGTFGLIHVDDDQYFAFYSKKVQLRVEYGQINLIEYGQQVDRRPPLAVVISPLLLLSKQRKHFLTVGYTGEDGKQQALVFRVDKGDIRATLVSLGGTDGVEDPISGSGGAKGGEGMKIQIGLAAVALVLAWAHLRAQQDSPRVVSAPLPEMENLAAQVVAVKRVYVDRLTGGETAAQMRDLIITNLQNSKLFILTENATARTRR